MQGSEIARRLHALVRTARDDAGDLGVRIRPAATISACIAANATKLYDVTIGDCRRWSRTARPAATIAAAQLANAGGDCMIVVNDAGDFVLRTHDGIEFCSARAALTRRGRRTPSDDTHAITGPIGADVADGSTWSTSGSTATGSSSSRTSDERLVSAARRGRRRAAADPARRAPPPRAASCCSARRGRSTPATASTTRCVFVTDLGELLIFTGSNPADAANWRQEGRYQIGAPLGMNAHIAARRRPADPHRRRHRAAQPGDPEGQRRSSSSRCSPATSSRCGATRSPTSATGRGRSRTGTSTAASSSPRPAARRAQRALPGRQQRDRRVVPLHLGRHLLHAHARATCFSARRTASSCRPTAPATTTACPTRRPWSAAGRRSSRAAQPGHLAPGPRRVLARAGEPFQPQLAATVDYRRHHPAAAAAGPRSRRARRLGRGSVG